MGDLTVYAVVSKYAYLRGMWKWNDVVHHKDNSADILCFNWMKPGFKKGISVQGTCNSVANNTMCNCSGDCWKIAQCSWKASGTFCTSICHNGRGEGNEKYMLLMIYVAPKKILKIEMKWHQLQHYIWSYSIVTLTFWKVTLCLTQALVQN